MRLAPGFFEMKKIIAVLMCAVMAAAFAGCGKKDKSIPTTDAPTTKMNYSQVNTAPVKVDEKLKKETFTKQDGSYAVDYFIGESSNYDSICNYDKNGKLVDMKKFTYDENGKRITAFNYDSSNNFTGGTAYEYDGDLLMKIYYYKPDGSLNYYESREYDANGNIVRAPIIDAEGNVLADGERTTAAPAASTTAK